MAVAIIARCRHASARFFGRRRLCGTERTCRCGTLNDGNGPFLLICIHVEVSRMLKQTVLTGCAMVCLSLAAPRQSEACLFSWLFGCQSCFRPVACCPSPCSTTACSPCSTGSCGTCGTSGGCATGDCNVNTYSIPSSDSNSTTWLPRYGVPAEVVVQPYTPAPVVIPSAPQPSQPEAPVLSPPETDEPVAVRQRTVPKTSVVRPASIRTTSVNDGWIPVGP